MMLLAAGCWLLAAAAGAVAAAVAAVVADLFNRIVIVFCAKIMFSASKSRFLRINRVFKSKSCFLRQNHVFCLKISFFA